MPTEKTKGLTVQEAADAIGVSVRTVRRWISIGMPTDVEHRGLQRIRRIDLEVCREWLKDHR